MSLPFFPYDAAGAGEGAVWTGVLAKITSSSDHPLHHNQTVAPIAAISHSGMTARIA